MPTYALVPIATHLNTTAIFSQIGLRNVCHHWLLSKTCSSGYYRAMLCTHIHTDCGGGLKQMYQTTRSSGAYITKHVWEDCGIMHINSC